MVRASKKSDHPEDDPKNDANDDPEGGDGDGEASGDDGNSEDTGPGSGSTHFGRQPGRTGPGRPGRTIPGKMTRSQAMKRLGCSKGRLETLVMQGKLSEPEKDSDGRWWYSVEEVEELVEDATSDEMSAGQIILATGKIIEQQGQAFGKIIDQQMKHNDELAKTMADMIEQTGKRETGFMGAFLGATQKILEVQTQWSEQAINKTQRLEAQLDDARETVVQAIELNQDREVRMAEAASRTKRNDKILESMAPHFPTVAGMLAANLSNILKPQAAAAAGGGTNPAVTELLSSIDPAQAQAIMSSGIFTPDQLAKLFALANEAQAEVEADKARKAEQDNAKKAAQEVTQAAMDAAAGKVPKVAAPAPETPS